MALGLPCISTDCDPGGAAYLITNEIDGILVRKNNVAELTKNISWLIENPIEMKKLGDNALNVKERFNLEEVGLQWSEFLLLNSKKCEE